MFVFWYQILQQPILRKTMIQDFDSLGIQQRTVQFLHSKGIHKPTEIQAKAIPLLRTHVGDFAARSATGTGKTFTYGIPLVERVEVSKGKIQAVVLVPTRELCEQVGQELTQLASTVEGLKVQAIYGGVPIKTQIHDLSNGVQILVATPGRLMDLVERKIVRLQDLDTVVFDEADEMLLKGFQKDIDRILDTTDRSYNSWLFSATMPDAIHILIKNHLQRNLKKIRIGEDISTNQEIVHRAVVLRAEEKQSVLLYYLTRFGNQQGIVFCRTKSGVQKLHRQLSKNKFKCGAVHGDLPQGLRSKVMQQFRDGHINLLLATDVAARGIDITAVRFVIQYHHADSAVSYTHRRGRTSRIGDSGISLTFLFETEEEKMQEIAAQLKLDMEYVDVPGFEEQLMNKALLEARKIAREKPLGDLIDDESRAAYKRELAHLSKDELLEKMLAAYLRS